ncbi:MAG: hypothetical protein HKN73_14575 [Gemmatimonadetes bacterium]|nr:hypothetical protein [Gemmatimonadota bacterium]
MSGADGALDGGIPGSLQSFLYYEDGSPRLAILDADITVSTSSGAPIEPTDLSLGAGDGDKARVLVAGLPLRDVEEPRLVAGERYGVRPVRSFEPRTDGGWLTLAETRQRVEPVEPTDLTGEGGLWLLPGQGLPQPGALQVSGYSNRFGAVSQGLLRLSPDPSQAGFRILTPSGLSDGALGQPFMLGDRDRGLLFRVDGLSASVLLLVTLLALFGIGALAFPVLGLGPGGAGVALAALGLVGLRTLLSISAWARYPFVDEGHHLSLWLIPAIPWLVGGVSRACSPRARKDTLSVVPRGFSGGFMGAPGQRVRRAGGVRGSLEAVMGVLVLGTLIVWARVLFPDSAAKAGVLAALALTVAGAVALSEAGLPARMLDRGVARVRGLWDRGVKVAFPGLMAGLGLAGLRIVLDAGGFREQVTLGGTRIGISVFYTPAVVALFALALWIHLDRVNRVGEGRSGARHVARAWIDLGGFMVLSLVLVSAWISDFGIVLTMLPGLAALMAAVGVYWRRRFGPAAALGGALPLFLFVLVQASPGALRPTALESPGESNATRLEEWSRNELLLLERGDPEMLGLIGESRSEALAVMRETMRSYTRGNWFGKGFLQGRVSAEIRTTAAREHAAGALVASQWGLMGALGLLASLLALVLPFSAVLPGGRRRIARGAPRGVLLAVLLLGLLSLLLPPPVDTLWLLGWIGVAGALAFAPLLPMGADGVLGKVWPSGPQPDGHGPETLRYAGGGQADGWWILGATAAATMVGAGLYMVLANYGLVLFTGKNVYLLGLDSVGDVLESLALLGLASAGLGRARRGRSGLSGTSETERGAGAVVPAFPQEWWRGG